MPKIDGTRVAVRVRKKQQSLNTQVVPGAAAAIVEHQIDHRASEIRGHRTEICSRAWLIVPITGLREREGVVEEEENLRN